MKRGTPEGTSAGGGARADGVRPGASSGFPVVGIGASAGGLRAFEAFFSGMPAGADPGMAFVLVQHLAPDHESVLADLVRRYTRMKVFEVQDGVAVRPNCAYIIAPNRDMTFVDGRLHLSEPAAPRGRRLPIDSFFRSLAEDQHERAIGIVLSGTGSDGTAGVRAIKGEGGMVMAQSPDSTEHDGMPRSAIATGVVDMELAPADMPAQLIAYVAHAFGRLPRQGSPPRFESELKKIFALLRARTGHDLSEYKPSTVERRVLRRMAVNQVESPEEYVRYMRRTPDEVDALFRELLIGVTRFFRDREAFETLAERVIPELFAGRPAGSRIRVWVPACSTGEEACSLAILLAEHQQSLEERFEIQLFATDIDERAIATARTGVHPASIAADVSPQRLARFFTPEPDGESAPRTYRIRRQIRDMMIFSKQDVTRDPPFSRLDLISCRNLMIYMSGTLQRRLLRLFHHALRPGGFLFLGTSETVGDAGELFTVLDRKTKVHRRKDGLPAGQPPALRRFAPSPALDMPGAPAAARRGGVESRSPRALTEQALLQHAVPAAALVDQAGDVLYIHGRTGDFLEPAPGKAGAGNILAMAREGLRRELTTALHAAASERTTVRRSVPRVGTNGSQAALDLVVRPVGGGPGSTEVPLYLVLMERAPQPRRASNPPGTVAAHAESVAADPTSEAARIASLEDELRAKEEYLQATTEELETSNEELMSSNEEMQSMNEELQSANEELETSKEELQSVNEELSTLNSELEAKVVDLSRANDDMANLLAGTGIATVFLDTSLQVLRFTPAATQIINLIHGDIGRPLRHVVSNLEGYDALVADARAVLDTLAPRSLDVRTAEGRWYAMRITPYRTLDNVIEGVVLTFVDVTEMKAAQHALRVNEERMRVALKTFPLVLFNQDRELRYTWIHAALPGPLDETALGKTDLDLFPEDEAERLTAIKRRVLETGIEAREAIRTSAGGRASCHDLTVEPLRVDGGEIVGITCAALEVDCPPSGERPEASGTEALS